LSSCARSGSMTLAHRTTMCDGDPPAMPTPETSAPTPKPWPDLRRLIREGLIDLALQPIVRTTTAVSNAVEAQTRPRPDSGFPNPGVLFAAADAFNLAWELEAVVRERLASAASTLPASHLLFFNTSPKVFGDPRYPDEIERFRERSRLTTDRFVLE